MRLDKYVTFCRPKGECKVDIQKEDPEYLEPNLCKLLDNIFFPLQIAELFIELKKAVNTYKTSNPTEMTHDRYQLRPHIRKIFIENCNEPRVMREQIGSRFRNFTQKLAKQV